MLRRDFTKSNKEYFKKNRNILITLGLFLLVGILMFAILGMNGNFEVKGYNEFSVSITETTTKKFSTHKSEISSIINSYDGKFDTLLIYSEGDDTKYLVRYLNNISDEDILEINELIAEEVGVNVENISEHVKVKGTVQNKDYIYTAASILLIVVVATIFAYARYNAASALAIIFGCLLGTLGFISFGSILRLYIGMSYFAMLVILNLLIVYMAISLFESMHKSSWLVSRDYGTAIQTAAKSSKFRTLMITFGLVVIGLLFILIAPLTIKYAAINLLFMAVTLLGTSLYLIPFIWSIFITKCRIRDYKIKSSAEGNNNINIK